MNGPIRPGRLRAVLDAAGFEDRYSARSYVNSQEVLVMLIDAYDDADVLPMWGAVPEGLTVDIITATPFGAKPRRRLVVTGFDCECRG